MPRIAKGGIDTKRLVAEIRKLPVLWDPSHEQYPSGGIRKMAWRKVSSILYNDFYLMDVTKQKKLCKYSIKLVSYISLIASFNNCNKYEKDMNTSLELVLEIYFCFQ